MGVAGLTLTALLLSLLTGCHKDASRLVIHAGGSVRLEALLPLHPAWEDVRQLDALLASPRRRPQPLPIQPPLSLDEVALPSPLRTEGTVPANLARARAEQTARPALERVERLRTALDVRNDRIMQRERASGQKSVVADVARREAEIMARVDAEERRIRAQVPPPLRDLQLREIALQSQVDALPEPHRSEAQHRLMATRQEIEQIRTTIEAGVADVRRRAAQEVDAYRNARKAEEAERLRHLQARLDRESDQIVAENEEEVRSSLNRLKALALPSVPYSPAVYPTRLPSPARVAARASPPVADFGLRWRHEHATPAVAPTSDQTAALNAQRRRLLDLITRDVRRQVERLAVEKRWNLSFASAPGLPDMTEQIAAHLRDAWRP